MIVDLVRNDLGRVAQTGSVKVEELFAVERYPTLWQMTSTVSAELRSEAGFYDIFRALFPCGSVTGAPKVRATQLIAELEAAPRGAYTGAIGFFSPRQTVFNVAIRTLELDGTRGTMGVGSGVVIDSDAAAEYRECLLKAEFLTGPTHRTISTISGDIQIVAQPDKFFLIETMLWDGDQPPAGYPFLALHLDRLQDSAEYFDFVCDRAAVCRALEDHARQFADQKLAGAETPLPRSPRRVRLLLDAEGERADRERGSSSSRRSKPHRPRAHRRGTHRSRGPTALSTRPRNRRLYNHAFEQASTRWIRRRTLPQFER